MSMKVVFKILKNGLSLTKNDIQSIFLGGYYFVINGKEVPFDWSDVSGTEKDGVFSFETGISSFGNDYELSDCYDNDYRLLGINREDITAEFLASAEKITEFNIDYVSSDGEDVELGENDDEECKIRLLEVSFFDMDTGTEYKVAQAVLDDFNNL